MYIRDLHLINFRNHNDLKLSFSDKINYIEGANATGKTSIAEAICTALNVKSFRQAALKNLLNFNADKFFIEANVVKTIPQYDEEYLYNIKFSYNNGSIVHENNKRVTSFEGYIFSNPILVYSPENEGLISDSQEKKRRFLDKVCFYKNKNHFRTLKNYNKLLKNKKNYLYYKNTDYKYLESITENLNKLSDYIQNPRKEIISHINSKIFEFSKNFPNKIENFQFIYEPSIIDFTKIPEEKSKKRVLGGAHLDKIYVSYNGKKYESFASFGQRKTFALGSLFTSVLIVEEFLNSGIVIILDDLEVGLDSYRINFFKEFFGKNQIFITGVINKHFKNAKSLVL